MNDLNDLNQKLAQFRASESPKPAAESADAQNMNIGLRAGTELVVSMVAGGAIGWGLDRWLGTKPWFMLVFLLLGICAGFMGIYRLTNNAGSAVGFAILQKGKKVDTKQAENSTSEK